MSCYIWFEDHQGFKIKMMPDSPSLGDIANAVQSPDTLNEIELMNRPALVTKVINLVNHSDCVSVSIRTLWHDDCSPWD